MSPTSSSSGGAAAAAANLMQDTKPIYVDTKLLLGQAHHMAGADKSKWRAKKTSHWKFLVLLKITCDPVTILHVKLGAQIRIHEVYEQETLRKNHINQISSWSKTIYVYRIFPFLSNMICCSTYCLLLKTITSTCTRFALQVFQDEHYIILNYWTCIEKPAETCNNGGKLKLVDDFFRSKGINKNRRLAFVSQFLLKNKT